MIGTEVDLQSEDQRYVGLCTLWFECHKAQANQGLRINNNIHIFLRAAQTSSRMDVLLFRSPL